MSDVLNLQEDGPELPDEEKASNSSFLLCHGSNKSNKSYVWC